MIRVIDIKGDLFHYDDQQHALLENEPKKYIN